MGERRERKRSVQSTISHPHEKKRKTETHKLEGIEERRESKRSVQSTISHPNEIRREIEAHVLQGMGERRESKRSVQSTISHPNARANNEQDEKSKLTCCKEWGNDEKANVPSS